MRGKVAKCREFSCDEEPFSGGLCRRHAEESAIAAKLRSDAIHLLNNYVVDNKTVSSFQLIEEVKELGDLWRRACNSVNYRISDPILLDEAQYAVDWCIDISKELVKMERLLRNGNTSDLEHSRLRRDITWERFRNLKNGLMSNGVLRPKK